MTISVFELFRIGIGRASGTTMRGTGRRVGKHPHETVRDGFTNTVGRA